MKKPLKFDIKLSFTSEILQNNKDNIDISSYLENLLNKKINIHLKINLDKIQQQFQQKKISISQINSLNNSEDNIEIRNSIEENPNASIIELEKEVIPKLILDQTGNKKLPLNKNFSKEKIFKPNKSTLVLDLDETLVYVIEEKNDNLSLPQIPFEYFILDDNETSIQETMRNVENESIEKARNYIIIRPGFSKFITQVKKYFDEIFVFTSSQYSYAEEIIKIIDKNQIISKIYSRKDCSFYNDIFYKDLNKIKKDLSQTIIIDNFPETYLLQHFNGLPIPSFMGDPKDNELLKLLPILEKLSKVKDVRNYIREIVSEDGQNILFKKAYELLKINQDEKNKNSKFSAKKNNNIKRNINLLNNNKLNNTWKKNNIKISDLIIRSNNKTIEHDSNEQYVHNDTNNYFFIEKDRNPTSAIEQINNNKIDNTKKIILTPNDINNKRMRKKNLILEYSYNNRKYNYQATIPTNPIKFNNSITEDVYSNLETPKKNKNKFIMTNNNVIQTQNNIFNSARHNKSKSLINNDDMNLFKNKIDYNLNVSRNNSNKNNISFKNYQPVSLKSIN